MIQSWQLGKNLPGKTKQIIFKIWVYNLFKTYSVEERVGIFNLSNAHKKQLQIDNAKPSNESSMVSSFILSRVASTISGITSRAYQSSSIVEITESETTVDKVHTTTSSVPLSSPSAIISDATADPMTRFKKLGQYLIELSVSCAIVIKQSPIPGLLFFK